jgi:isoleucyl-tRNA synthetase
VGLAARNAVGLKVRKPLGRALLVAPPDVERAVRVFEADILDELNVERLETVPTLGDRVAVSVELDMDDTSALPPDAVPTLRAALAARPGPMVRDTLLAAGHVTVPVGEVEVRLGWADLRFRVEGRGGFAAAADRELIVALDTTMTPDLQRKALARHLVHQIQLMRKEARFNVDDRIRIAVDAHGDVAAAIEEHSRYICGETLAVALRCGSPPGGWLTREIDLEEARVSVAVGRA